MKQTAVEWLIENIPDLGKYIPFGASMELHAKFQQAIEMEKEQIIEAHGLIAKLQEDGSHKLISGETYYDETYKKNNL
jgi:hypothetical protein